ncbi:MAG: hypothetical protein ACRCVT_02510, partial [Leadbetterella sp.]
MNFKLLFALLSITIGISISSYGQKDLIVTQSGEEIRCRILDESTTRFKYAYLGPNNKVMYNEIFKNLVASFKFNYYSEDLLQASKSSKKKNK